MSFGGDTKSKSVAGRVEVFSNATGWSKPLSMKDILEANSLKGLYIPNCPLCLEPWDATCPHVIYTFTGPVYMER